MKRSALEKLNQWRTEEEATDTASEGEGGMAVSTRTGEELTSQKTQTYEDGICRKLDEHLRFPVYINCLHSTYFQSVQPQRKKTNCSHILLDFNSHGEFMNTLQFLLPNVDRKMLIYWDNATRKSIVIDTEKLFECGNDDQDVFNEDEDQDNTTLARPSAHKLSVEDEYLLALMKLRMGLSTIDLAERFCVTESAEVNIFLTWINYL